MSGRPVRRIGAVHLPDLLCEIASSPSQPKGLPFAVIEALPVASSARARGADVAGGGEQGGEEEIARTHVLVAANDVAHRFGVRAGQTVAEARALLSNLAVRRVTSHAVRQALGRVAEVALSFGPTASIESGDTATPLGTVWIDLTGAAHLRGGEEATLLELASRVRELGHRVRAAIAEGPRLARAAAMFGASAETIVPAGGGREAMRSFPLEALPIARDRAVWLRQLGLWTVEDLAKLPFESLAGRLGDLPGRPAGDGAFWREALALARGEDDAPLVVYEPSRSPSEEVAWDEPVASVEPLLFALRGLASRLSARLQGRGEAAQAVELAAPYDRSIAKLRRVQGGAFGFRVELPAPLSHREDLFRVLKSKLESAALEAPVTGLSVTVAQLTRAPRVQLSLAGDKALATDPRAMAILLAELSAEIGEGNVGVLSLRAVHRPEARTELVPLRDLSPRRPPPRDRGCEEDGDLPVRLLPQPVPLFITSEGVHSVSIDNQPFTLRRAGSSLRFDQVEWWTSSPLSRDYEKVWLTSGKKKIAAWIFTDRSSGRAFLHGFFD